MLPMMAPRDLVYRSMNMQENIQPEMRKEAIPFIVLATLAVVTRGFSRRCRHVAFGADDYMTLLALVSF